mmetsp:Transcript_12905/g.14152  ORF Transcript_12905/g.14152 Transcript_12905/m.14152 type:complete len:128 (-) Transcript_12905:1492-1875(-)
MDEDEEDDGRKDNGSGGVVAFCQYTLFVNFNHLFVACLLDDDPEYCPNEAMQGEFRRFFLKLLGGVCDFVVDRVIRCSIESFYGTQKGAFLVAMHNPNGHDTSNNGPSLPTLFSSSWSPFLLVLQTK